ncbi:DUF6660 family protein [Flavobacterium sp. GT2N3]|uniref:DUF6660 family protein n=1 Tax=unclassified Flavobacterium TaxID=196869 RepID=UPI003AAFE53E
MNLILSIYLIALSFLPCADLEANDLAHTAKELSSFNQSHSHNKEKDSCSPFCICNCCGAQISSYFPTTTFNLPTVSAIIKLPLPTYKSILTSNFYGSIWQPPQINA